MLFILHALLVSVKITPKMAVEMTQWLRVYTDLAEDLSLISSTYVEQLTTPVVEATGDSGLHGHTYTNNNNSNYYYYL